MLFWVSRQILISVIVVVLIHSIYTFLQETLTTPKIRDLVHRPAQQYNEIYSTLAEQGGNKGKSANKGQDVDNSQNAITPGGMKNELQDYLRELSDTVVPSGPTVGIYDTGRFQTI